LLNVGCTFVDARWIDLAVAPLNHRGPDRAQGAEDLIPVLVYNKVYNKKKQMAKKMAYSPSLLPTRYRFGCPE
jgi:hypothetical protein